MAESNGVWSNLPDDIAVSILLKVDGDPRDWARLACVSTKLSSLVRDVCFRIKCSATIPSLATRPPGGRSALFKLAFCCPGLLHAGVLGQASVAPSASDVSRSTMSHLASGSCSLSREQGNKLLASRFRDDCLYICHWPGCVHIGERRKYMLFRGVFEDFRRSRVWRTINDSGGRRSKIGMNCAFCSCSETWDLHSAFCLRRVHSGYHDDGEPVVRAYVCENGHVSGAWTAWPMYT